MAQRKIRWVHAQRRRERGGGRPRPTRDHNRMRWHGEGMPRLRRGRGRGTRAQVVFHQEGAGSDRWRDAEDGWHSSRRLAEDQSRMRWQGKGVPRQRESQARTGKPATCRLSDRHVGRSGAGVEREREKPRPTRNHNRMRRQGRDMPRLRRDRGRGTRARVVISTRGKTSQGVDHWRGIKSGQARKRRRAGIQGRMRWQGKDMPRPRISPTDIGRPATPVPADHHEGRPGAGVLEGDWSSGGNCLRKIARSSVRDPGRMRWQGKGKPRPGMDRREETM